MCMAWTKKDDAPEKHIGNGFCCRCQKKVPAKQRSEFRTITRKGVTFEYLHYYAYCPHCGENIYISELNDLNVENKNKSYQMAKERRENP